MIKIFEFSQYNENDVKYQQISTNTLFFDFVVSIILDGVLLLRASRGNDMDKNINDKWINIEEAAEYLGIKPVTLRGWIRNNKGIPAHKIGKQWKFKCSELDAWVKSGKSAID